MNKKYNRILLKLSGEALLGKKEFGMDTEVLDKICKEVKKVYDAGVEIVIVIGAGNIWRGAANHGLGIDRVPSDYIGMMGTIMNSIALQARFEDMDIDTRICSALDIPSVAESYIRRKAERHLEKGRIVICAAGTGNPYFTTDSAAALRSLELKCDVLIKATNVDGIYTADPKKDPSATRYEEVSFEEVLEKNLKVMDGTAIAQCRDNKMPIIVLELMKEDNILSAVCGEDVGTKVIS